MSKPVQKPFVVLIEHTRQALHVLDDIRAAGFRILYLGKDRALQELSDLYYGINPLIDLDGFLASHLAELRELPLAGVFTLSEHQKFAERRLAMALGLPAASAETMRLGRDKWAMRKRMAEVGIPAPAFQFILDSEANPKPPLPFPFIIKPNFGYSSAGVQLVRDTAGFLQALKTIRRLNQFALGKTGDGAPEALCEEYIDGPEYSVDAITVAGKTRCFCICRRGFPGQADFQDYIYLTPSSLSAEAQRDLEREVHRVLWAFGHTDGPSHTEVRFDAVHRRWVILETAYRVGFSGNIGLMHASATGVKYNQLALRSALRHISFEEVERSFRQPARHALLFTPATGKGGIVREIGGLDLLENDPRIVAYSLAKQPGQTVIAYPKGVDYLGFVLAVESTAERIDQLASEIARKVRYEY